MFRSLILVVCAVLGAGCATSTSDALSVQPFGTSALQWEGCPAPWNRPRIECARVQVPRRWSDPAGEKLTVILRRVRSATVSRGQLWGLDGGPGFAGDVFFDEGFLALTDRAGLDLIVPSHRGTVDESALACPGVDISNRSNWGACVGALVQRWGPGLDGFDATSAAMDVAHLMDRVSTEGERLVYGGSYGSIWGQRLLQVRPQGIERMWLDSIVDLEGTLERSDEHAHAAMQDLLRLCSQDASCRSMFDGEPLEVAGQVRRAYLEGLGCGQAEGFELQHLQGLMFSWLSGPPSYWALAVAGYARAARCDQADPGALLHALERQQRQSPDGAGFLYNPVLNRHILFRELYRFDVDLADRSQAQSELLATRGADRAIAQEAPAFGEGWRRVVPVQTPETSTELVLLSGQLDPLDLRSWAERTAERWPSSIPVFVTWAGHSVIRYLGTSEGQCGARLLGAFLSGASLPVSCINEQTGPDFSGAEDDVRTAAQDWFGAPLY